jgi:hypothetical protein
MTGTFLANPIMVPRKSPNNMNIPYNSTRKPKKVHRIKIMKRPTKKAAVPLSFCFRAKKRRVLEGPIMIVRPRRKSIYLVLERKAGKVKEIIRCPLLTCG